MAPSDSKGTDQEGQDELSQVKRKLAWRMGVAGLMIVALLGGLMLFDRVMTNPADSETAAPRFTEPVPVPKKTVTQPLGTAESTPSAAKEEKKEAKESAPEATSVPADRAVPGTSLPPRPEVAAQPAPERPARQASRPVTTAPATAAAGRPAEQKGGVTAASPAPRSDASTTGTAPAPAVQRQPAVLPKLLNGYTLQAGVFADQRRAEDLHARLVQEGIPATLETRVLVGPFQSREEADTARAKMLVLGVDAVQLPRSGKK